MRATVFAALGYAVMVSAAFAGASSEALPQRVPQPANITPYEISLKAFDACLVVQSRLMQTTREDVHTPCSCYAKATIKAMSKEDLADFRATGYFNDETREKALGFLDKCGLKRPL